MRPSTTPTRYSVTRTSAVMSRDQSVTSPSSHSLLSVSGDWRDGGSLSHDGQLFSHLARRRSKEDAAEAKQMESHQAEERTSPLPPDADMKTTLEWLRKEMVRTCAASSPNIIFFPQLIYLQYSQSLYTRTN